MIFPRGGVEKSLYLVRFYLPRLLAAAGHTPEAWVNALALQKLGEFLLERLSMHYHLRDQPLPVTAKHTQRALHRLGRRLWALHHARARSQAQQAANWPELRDELARCLWAVEQLMASAVEAGR